MPPLTPTSSDPQDQAAAGLADEKPYEDRDLIDMPVRAEHVIWIPGALIDIDALPDVFEDEFVDWLPEGSDRQIYQELPVLRRFAGCEDTPDALDVAEALALSGTNGFLIQAATPSKKYHSENGCQYSWGRYRSEWLYAASEAEIGPVMLSWAAAEDAKFRAAFAASKPEA